MQYINSKFYARRHIISPFLAVAMWGGGESNGLWYSVGEGWSLQLLPFGHLGALLELVVVDDVLVGGAALNERVELVHFGKVPPECGEVAGYVEVGEEGAGDAYVLQLGHQFAVEAAHGVAGEEAKARVGLQVGVDLLEVGQQ